ncbi:MAG TPA: ATP-binding protein [Candidatus Saccharimonadales bacterium]
MATKDPKLIRIEEDKSRDEAILASIGDGLFVVDLDGNIILINKAFENMLGWKISEIRGKSFVEIIPAEDENGRLVPPKLRPISTAIESGQEIAQSKPEQGYYLVRKDKSRFPIAYKVTLVKLGGKTIGAVGVFRDVTEEIETSRAKTEFVAIASHQLRTPLGITKWYLETLRQDDYFKKAPDGFRACIEELYKNNERVLTLVRNLLSVSRIDQGRVEDEPQPTNVTRLVEDILKEMTVVAKEKNITLLLTAKPDLPSMYIDPVRLHEAIENVIINAIDYNIPSGKVKINVKRVDDELRISIQDTGIGMTAKDQERLFTKFFRSTGGSGHKAGGSGLGLYVAKSYIDKWSGRITVESKVGKGSTFTIALPFKN